MNIAGVRIGRGVGDAKAKTPRTVGLEDPQDFVSRNEFDLGNTVAVPEDDTDLGRGQTSSSEFEDLVRDFFRGGFGP